MSESTRSTSAEHASFLNTAIEKGIDAAIQKHGNLITANEALALKSLSVDELESLKTINAKILKVRGLDEDWTCVNVVC